MRAEGGKVPDEAFDDELRKVHIQMRSLFVDYASLYQNKRTLFRVMHQAASATDGRFRENDLASLVDDNAYDIPTLRNELANLVRQNFLAYNPVTAEFSLQGRSMEIGLKKFIESLDSRES